MQDTQSLTVGSPFKSLIKFTFPILLSLLLQITYGLVDLLVVGQFSSISNVAGVTIGSQIMQTITSLASGLCMGVTILIGQYIGANKPKETGEVIAVSIALFTAIAGVLTVFLVLFTENIAIIMQTPVEAFKHTCDYILYCGIGIIFIVFYNLLGSIFRGMGDAKTPFISVAIACVVNVLLDLLFVAVYDMGARGAALATVIAQAASVILSLIIIRKRNYPFTFKLSMVRFTSSYIKSILKLGIPVALQGVLVSISFLFITSIINPLGVSMSAAVGVVEKITGIIMIVPMAFMQALSAFTAQNYGANKFERMRLGLSYAMLLSLIFGVIMSYLSAFHGEIFTRVFIDDPETTQASIQYLRAYAIDTFQVCIMFTMNGYFNGCGQTNFVMLHSVLSAFLIRIPCAYLFSQLPQTNLFLIGLSTPLSTFIQVVCCIVYYHYLKRKQEYRNV